MDNLCEWKTYFLLDFYMPSRQPLNCDMFLYNRKTLHQWNICSLFSTFQFGLWSRRQSMYHDPMSPSFEYFPPCQPFFFSFKSPFVKWNYLYACRFLFDLIPRIDNCTAERNGGLGRFSALTFSHETWHIFSLDQKSFIIEVCNAFFLLSKVKSLCEWRAFVQWHYKRGRDDTAFFFKE